MAPLRRLAAVAFLAAAVAAAQTPYSGLGAQSVPPETIRAYAPPPLEPEVSRRIQTMLDLRSPGIGQVTPDGKRLFFGWSITGAPMVWRLDGPHKVEGAVQDVPSASQCSVRFVRQVLYGTANEPQ